MSRTPILRRSFLAGLAALPAAPALCRTTAALDAALDAAAALTQLNALVLARRGRILAARAFRGPDPATPVNVKSVSKSLISALTGIAIARGELSGPDQRIAPLLRRSVPRRADPRVRLITVGDLLSMRSGLQAVSGPAYGAWADSAHPLYDALSRPMVAEPGTEMLYSTASYHILGAILAAVAGQDLHALAQDRLGDPLGIRLPPWTRDPQGLYLGGNDMALPPLALIRFGETYRSGGLWQGRRVVPRDWIAQSWQVRTHSLETGHGYGYGWFVWRAGGHDVFYARGYGGQMIFIAPELELTVAITSDAALPATPEGHLGALFSLLAHEIMPAVESLG